MNKLRNTEVNMLSSSNRAVTSTVVQLKFVFLKQMFFFKRKLH